MLSSIDRRDLQWLEIGHYTAAGLALLFTAGAWFMSSRMTEMLAVAQPPAQAEAMNAFMEGAMLLSVGFQASFVVTFALVGFLVRQRAGYWTCFALSGWNLLLMPFGTAAGVFMFILLRRPGVESAFRGDVSIAGEDLAAPPVQPDWTPAPSPAVDPIRAESDLSPLPVLHYALAALTFVMGCFPIVHVGVGLAMLANPDFAGDKKGADPELIGSFFLGVGLLLVVMLWSTAAAVAVTGRFIRQRRRHTFCLVASAVNCFFFPFGTALGVYTLVVLNRDYVKAAFSRPPETE